MDLNYSTSSTGSPVDVRLADLGGGSMLAYVAVQVMDPDLQQLYADGMALGNAAACDLVVQVMGYRIMCAGVESAINSCLASCSKAQAGKDFVTILHPEQHSIALLQPGADKSASWNDEYRECLGFVDQLHRIGWQDLLIVYNGGGVTEQEILDWAKLGKRQPGKWNVLLINGTGRKADDYACDSDFLDKYPNFHVAENNVSSLRAKLVELNAIVLPGESARSHGCIATA